MPGGVISPIHILDNVNDIINNIFTMSDNERPTREAWLSHGPDEVHLMQELMRTSQALISVFSRQVGLQASRLALLRQIAIAGPGGLGVISIARRLGINPAAVTRQTREMEDDGLLARRRDANDARRSYVRLTPKGRRLFSELHERGHALERTLGNEISAEDIATTTRVLTRLRKAIEGLR